MKQSFFMQLQNEYSLMHMPTISILWRLTATQRPSSALMTFESTCGRSKTAIQPSVRLGFSLFTPLLTSGVDLVDIKPENMEELTEVITAVQCHPQHCNILTYSSSRGLIKVCDLRTSAVCHQFSKVYAEHSAPTANKSFITDILNSISDIKWESFSSYSFPSPIN